MDVSGAGGAARSSAKAIGHGASAVRASARAEGGHGGRNGYGGPTIEPFGTGGDAMAFSEAEGLGEVHSVARATGGRGGDSPDEWVASGTALARVSAIGASGDVRSDADQVSVLDEGILLGFLNPDFAGDFGSLRFRATLGQESLVDVTFADVDAALAYFDDRVVALEGFPDDPSGSPFDSALNLSFAWNGTETGSSRFGVDLLVGLTPVPEPSTALLLAFGLAVLAARAQRRRGAAI